MSSHLQMCKIPQFKNPMELRQWRQNHVANCMKCMLEIEHRKIREQNWLKKMKETQEIIKLRKDILNLELEEYFIPSTPNSPQSIKSVESCSYSSTKGISEGFSLYNTNPEHHIGYIRDGYTSSDSVDNFDTFKLSPAQKPIYSNSECDSDVNSLDEWDNIKDYGDWIS